MPCYVTLHLKLFLSTPSARRATGYRCVKHNADPFLSTPSARRATRVPGRGQHHRPISIHALREEGDLRPILDGLRPQNFYPRPPRGGRPVHRRPATCLCHFYPRPPRGGRRQICASASPKWNFYPRPPRGGRPLRFVQSILQFQFLSTPSARRATAYCTEKYQHICDFYPRPPRGGRLANSRHRWSAV